MRRTHPADPPPRLLLLADSAAIAPGTATGRVPDEHELALESEWRRDRATAASHLEALWPPWRPSALLGARVVAIQNRSNWRSNGGALAAVLPSGGGAGFAMALPLLLDVVLASPAPHASRTKNCARGAAPPKTREPSPTLRREGR